MEDGSSAHPFTIVENSGIEMVKTGSAEVISKTEPRGDKPTEVVLRTKFVDNLHYRIFTGHPDLFPAP